MKKRLIAGLIFAVTMLYLSISVSAVGTFGSQAFVFVASNKTSTTTQSWQSLTIDSNNYQTLNNTSGSSQNKYMYLSFKTNQVPQDGYILVITITLDTIADRDTISLLGVGQADTGTIPTSTSTAAKLGALQLNQEIIASTIADNGTGNTRLSVTFKAKQFANQYPIAAWSFSKNGTLNSVTCANVQLFETVEDAAGSGTTPEEMREVLSAWGEEELIPGIGEEVGDQIEDKVPGAVEDALNNHDQQQETQAGSKIEEFKEQLQDTIDPYFENTTEIRDALHGGLTGVFGYSGTNAVITFPAANNPMADGALLWPELTVDLGYWWNQLPTALRSMITIYATFVILYCCLSEMLDTINTILIHRELLGLPDDQFGINAKSRSE